MELSRPGLAKISAPTPTDIVARPRLYDALDAARQRPVTWVSGPAGCGKTALIADCLRQRKLACLWHQIDTGDGDAASFFHHLRLAARKIAPRSKAPVPMAFAPEFAAGLNGFARRFFRDTFARFRGPFVVVLDNLQEAPAGSAIASILHEGLAELSPHGHLLLVSRLGPPPALSRLRASRGMSSVGCEELRFTRDEADRLVRRLAPALWEDHRIPGILAATGGWVAGLVLVLANTAIGSPDPLADPITGDDLFGYFATEVFNGLAPDRQDFLVRTALLPEMTGATARGLTGEPGAGVPLAQLARDGFFTDRQGGTDPVYQDHPLFREFLWRRGEALLPSAEYGNARRKAAALLEAAGNIEAAISLLAAAKDWLDLTRLIAVSAPAMVERGQHLTIANWFAAIPKEVVDGSAALLLWRGAAGLLNGPAAAREDLSRACALFKEAGDVAGQWSAWCATIETYMVEFGWLGLLFTRWVSEFRELRQAHPQFPSRELEARALGNYLWTYPPVGLDEGEYRECAERPWVLARETADAGGRRRWASPPVAWFCCRGDLARVRILLETLRPESKQTCPPQAWIMGQIAEL